MREKTWGWTKRVYVDAGLQVELLSVLPGGYTSIHLHRTKFNQFIVVSGSIRLRKFQRREDHSVELCLDEALFPGDHRVFHPGVLHQFEGLEQSVLYEVYWPAPGHVIQPDEIVRLSENGRRQV